MNEEKEAMLEFIGQVHAEVSTLLPYLGSPWKENMAEISNRAVKFLEEAELYGEALDNEKRRFGINPDVSEEIQLWRSNLSREMEQES